MADTALEKIIDAYAALLTAYGPLAGETIFTDRSPDEAIEDGEMPATCIYAEAWRFGQDEEQGQTRHEALLNFERIESSTSAGLISRSNQQAIAHIVAAIHADRTLGGRVEDAQERDVAPPMDNGKSVGGASLQMAVQFLTPRGDHFTISGQAGQTF